MYNKIFVLVLIWFALVLGVSWLGLFSTHGIISPILVIVSVLLPPLLFFIVHSRSHKLQQFFSSLSIKMLTLLQTWRLVGIIFLILYGRGELPGTFALPAGWGDIAVGITAPFIALASGSRQIRFRRTFIAWNIFGILDFIVATTLGILSSQSSSFGLLAQGVTIRPITILPLSLIPTFAVPLFIILHLIAIMRTRSL
jgi:hypothetical protein